MKKIAIILLFLVFILPRARSQDDDIAGPSSGGGEFLFGVKVGLVSSTFASQFQKLENAESMTGIAAGLFGEYKFNESIGVSVEALYVQEGTMRIDPNYIYYNTSYEGSNYVLTRENSNILLHNMEIPVLVNYYLPEIGGLKLKAFAGPSFDYLLRARAKNLLSIQWANQQSVVLDQRATDDVTSNFTSYCIGAIIGAGVTYDKYTLDVSFKWGVTPINNLASYNNNNYNGREDYSTNTLLIKLGVNIDEFLK